MVVSLILLQVITFVVIIVVLNYVFGSQLKAALNRLQVLHQENLEKEEVLNKELERAKVQCEAEIARSKEEAKTIIENAKQNSENMLRESAERAQIEARKTYTEAVERGKRMEEEMRAGVEEKAVGLAQELIRYTFTQEDQKGLQAQLIDELIGELGKIDKTRLAVKTDRAQVLTSWPLSDREKESLKQVLAAKLGAALAVEEEIDPSLIFGIVIKLGGVVVDGSLKNKLNKALHAMHLKNT